MDILSVFFIICGLFIVLGIIGVLSLGKSQEKAEIVNYMERCDKAVEKGLNASSAEKVRERCIPGSQKDRSANGRSISQT